MMNDQIPTAKWKLHNEGQAAAETLRLRLPHLCLPLLPVQARDLAGERRQNELRGGGNTSPLRRASTMRRMRCLRAINPCLRPPHLIFCSKKGSLVHTKFPPYKVPKKDLLKKWKHLSTNRFWRMNLQSSTTLSGKLMVCIWEEHQFFGSKSKKLREKIARTISATRNMYGKIKLEDARTMNEKAKLEHSNGELLQKIISGYFHVYDEDAWVRKCQAAIRIVDKVEKELGTSNSSKSGTIATNRVQEVLQIQHHRLEECIGQLKTTKSSRKNLITLFKQALQEQDMKSALNHRLLEAATSRHIKTGTGISSEMEAKLTSSSSSAKLQNLLFSLVSAGVIGLGESPVPKKKLKTDSNASSQVPTSEPLLQPPVQLVLHLQSSSMEFPPLPPLPFPSTKPIASPTQTLLIQTSAGSSKGVPSRYNSSPSPLSNYPAMGKHSDPNSLNSHPSSLVMEGQNLSVQPPFQMVPPLLARKQRIHYLKTLVAKYGTIPK